MQDSRRSFFTHQAQTSPYPIDIEISRAEGSWLYGPNGEKYLDFISGIGVANIGHSHPDIIKAIKTQIDRHMHVMVYGEYRQSAQYLLATELASLLPESLNMSYFVNSGAEANEAAMKLVKRATGRTEILAFRGAYHGSTHGTLSLAGNEDRKRAFRPLLPDIGFLTFNDPRELNRITNRTAAVFAEVIQGDAGIRIPDKKYVTALRKRCTETGTLLVFDEIQSGMGRTGKLFAFEHYNVVPDLLTIGKAFGGGMPIAALVASNELMELFTRDPVLGHITTFGGHPVNCAAALANLEVLTNQIDFRDVLQKGEYITEKLMQIPGIQQVRSKGLYIAVDLESPEKVNGVIESCRSEGLLLFYFLSTRNSFRIAPPLNISMEDLDFGIEVINKSIQRLK
jgi:acetylornithine/N-succinyldiaminopimelate aminotransferase